MLLHESLVMLGIMALGLNNSKNYYIKIYNYIFLYFCSSLIIISLKREKYLKNPLAEQACLPSETYHPSLSKELFTTKDLCQCSALKHE